MDKMIYVVVINTNGPYDEPWLANACVTTNLVTTCKCIKSHLDSYEEFKRNKHDDPKKFVSCEIWKLSNKIASFENFDDEVGDVILSHNSSLADIRSVLMKTLENINKKDKVDD